VRYHITIAEIPDKNKTDQDWFYDEEFDSSASKAFLCGATDGFVRHIINRNPDRREQDKTYRLTPTEYEIHLIAHDDVNPQDTMKCVREAEPRWVLDPALARGSASYDSEGFYWVRTSDLRVAI
jgi:hypothetical protein